jgi:glyoxylase I family protein
MHRAGLASCRRRPLGSIIRQRGKAMPSRGSLSHIDISAGSPELSIRFYDTLLSCLGYKRRTIKHPEWFGHSPSRATWECRNADGSRFEIEVRPAAPELRNVRYDRYRPGLHHIAFHADSDAVVDAAYNAIVAIGGEVLDAPHNFGGSPGYGEYYYATFFSDPDGFKIEVCHVPEDNP